MCVILKMASLCDILFVLGRLSYWIIVNNVRERQRKNMSPLRFAAAIAV